MITQKSAASRLPLKVSSTAFAALLILGLPLAAQSRGGHGGGGGGSAHSTGGGSHSSASGGASHNSGGSSGGDRTAHGVPGGSSSSSSGQRQPGSHGGFHGHGGYYGGYGYPYGGYYYPYGGFWPGFSFSWWGYDDPYYYYHGYPGYYGGYSGGYYDRSQTGALDLDVAPGRTHVFVNGEDLGEVDRYDGWPGYLWLPRGTYDVAFYLDGYKTIARQITVYPGTVIDIDDRMAEGQSVRPEDLATKSHQRRDERIGYERQRRERLDRQAQGDQAQGDDDDQDWHDRVRRDHGSRMRHDRDDDQGGQADRDDDDQGGPMDHSAGGAHLRLSVEPQDASVYLDGQFVGTGTDLSLLHTGLPVAPGTHRLAVVRPGHRAVEKSFEVKSGGNVDLDIALESGPGR